MSIVSMFQRRSLHGVTKPLAVFLKPAGIMWWWLWSKTIRYCPLAILFVFATPSSSAQVDAGSITGTVTDISGADIPGVKVDLLNENTGVTASTITDGGGNYTFAPVRIGTYTVTLQGTGFNTQKVQHLLVNIQQQIALPVTLALQTQNTNVEVTTEGELLQTQNGSVGQVLQQEQINNLPLNGRNYFFLAQLAPGVTYGQADSRGENQNGRFIANGQRATQNNYLLDGIDNNSSIISLQNGKDFVIQTPVDALSEFKIQTNSYSAQFGRAAGAVLNATVKSGTNQLHGDVWQFLRNEAFDANDYFLNQRGIRRPKFRRNQFGFTLGGPVLIPKVYDGRDRTFFFVDYEGLRQSQGNTIAGTVPTLAQRNSGFTNFSDLLTASSNPADALGRKYSVGTIFDPSTTRVQGATYVRDPFAGNVIPAGRIDANAVNLLNLLPAPNGPGTQNNYTTAPLYTDNNNSYDIRIDQVAGKKDYIFGRYSYNVHHQQHPGIYALYQQGYADGGNSSSRSYLEDVARNFAFGYTHTFSSRLVNDLRIGVNREVVLFSQANAGVSGIPEQFGIQGIPKAEDNGGLPTFSVGALTSFGAYGFLPAQKYGTTPQINDDITISRGAHSIKIGFQGQRVYNPYQQAPASRGSFTFNGSYTSVYGQTDGTTAIGQLLLLPTATSNLAGANAVSISSIPRHHLVRNYFAGYVQDDWKASQKLTLNLGLRYDFYGPLGEQQNQIANFIPGAGRAGGTYLVTPEVNAQLPSSFVNALSAEGVNVQVVHGHIANAQKLNFSPRLGFAYQASQRLVVRVGFGLFYGGIENIGGSPLVTSNFPLEYTLSKTATNAATPLAADNSVGLLETTFLNLQPTPSGVTPSAISLIGLQRDVNTTYVEAYNLALQYQITRDLALTAMYVGSSGRHILVATNLNSVGELLAPGTNITPYLPYKTTAVGGNNYTVSGASNNYNSGQLNLESRKLHGLTLLTNFAWQRSMSNARDPLEGTVGGYRAPWVPGFGIGADWQRADYDVKRVFHASGTYELPYGTGRTFGAGAGRFAQAFLGGWVTNAIATVQDGQPFTVGCAGSTTTGTSCFANLIPGQSPYANSSVSHFISSTAFSTPAVFSATNTTVAVLGSRGSQVTGPAFRRLDASLFKQFHLTERYYAEFRGEVFNVTNTANFSNPATTNLQTPTSFGQITSTRDSPNDPREVQLALKFYW
jgi:hypothetical protein